MPSPSSIGASLEASLPSAAATWTLPFWLLPPPPPPPRRRRRVLGLPPPEPLPTEAPRPRFERFFFAISHPEMLSSVERTFRRVTEHTVSSNRFPRQVVWKGRLGTDSGATRTSEFTGSRGLQEPGSRRTRTGRPTLKVSLLASSSCRQALSGIEELPHSCHWKGTKTPSDELRYGPSASDKRVGHTFGTIGERPETKAARLPGRSHNYLANPVLVNSAVGSRL